MRHTLAAAITASALASSPFVFGRAEAAPITYTETTTASGRLGTTAFVDADITLNSVGDTAGVVAPAPGLFINPVGTASVTVDGVGTGVFDAGGQASILSRAMSGAGIGANSRDPDVDQSGQTYILATDGPAFAAYDPSGPIGPVVGPAVFRPGLAFSTDAGDFALTSAGDVTHTATSGATTVPDPAGLGLARRRAARLRSDPTPTHDPLNRRPARLPRGDGIRLGHADPGDDGTPVSVRC